MFVLLYDTEVVDEEAFLKWKEDVSEKHPGKGKALFQVGIIVMINENTKVNRSEDVLQRVKAARFQSSQVKECVFTDNDICSTVWENVGIFVALTVCCSQTFVSFVPP